MIIYGKNTVLEAINSNKTIKSVYVTNNTIHLIKNKIPANLIKLISQKEMDLKFKGNNQGLGAIVDDYHYHDLEEIFKLDKKNISLAILDGLSDPHNLGAILRTADATGIDGIIIPKNRSVSLNDTVAKVSTGAIEYVPTFQVTNINQTIKLLKEHGFWVVGLDMDGDMNYTDYDYEGKNAIVVGNEGKGISRLTRESCDTIISIPMIGHVESLNASVSCSLIFYEILRKRG